MNKLIEKEKIIIIDETQIKDKIYCIRNKKVMLDKEISATKCHGYLYDKIVTLCGYNVNIPVIIMNCNKITPDNKILLIRHF